MYAQQYGAYPDADALAQYVHQRDGITGADGRPVAGADVESFVAEFQEREYGTGAPALAPAVEEGVADADPGVQQATAPRPAPETLQETASAGAHAAKEQRGPSVNAPIDEQPAPPGLAGGDLTVVDRYFMAWMDYQAEPGDEPGAEQLSAYLAQKGMHGRGGKRVSPSTLRAVTRSGSVSTTSGPSTACAPRTPGWTVTPAHVTEQADDFERR
jgi:hypothetical protein